MLLKLAFLALVGFVASTSTPDSRCPPGNPRPPVHLQHDTDCTLFYLCINGNRVLMPPCPAGSHFDLPSSQCRPVHPDTPCIILPPADTTTTATTTVGPGEPEPEPEPEVPEEGNCSKTFEKKFIDLLPFSFKLQPQQIHPLLQVRFNLRFPRDFIQFIILLEIFQSNLQPYRKEGILSSSLEANLGSYTNIIEYFLSFRNFKILE